MPWGPPRPCRWPNCPALVPSTEKSAYCEKHRPMERRARYEAEKLRRPSAHKRGYDRTWWKARKQFLSGHALCEECLRHGRIVPATEVHHKIPLRAGGYASDETLEALCKSCHAKKTNAERNRYPSRGYPRG